MKALTLIRLAGKEPERMLSRIKAVKGVQEAFLVFGRFDIAAFLSAPDLDGIKGCVKSIQSIAGVKRTETLIGV